jgi:hypothetical protein
MFTRACEIERQDKRKQWYDKNATVREFKAGEKVFVLLFIHCLPLPYILSKRRVLSPDIFGFFSSRRCIHNIN